VLLRGVAFDEYGDTMSGTGATAADFVDDAGLNGLRQAGCANDAERIVSAATARS
jgi:hypothetical protein